MSNNISNNYSSLSSSSNSSSSSSSGSCESRITGKRKRAIDEEDINKIAKCRFSEDIPSNTSSVSYTIRGIFLKEKWPGIGQEMCSIYFQNPRYFQNPSDTPSFDETRELQRKQKLEAILAATIQVSSSCSPLPRELNTIIFEYIGRSICTQIKGESPRFLKFEAYTSIQKVKDIVNSQEFEEGHCTYLEKLLDNLYKTLKKNDEDWGWYVLINEMKAISFIMAALAYFGADEDSIWVEQMIFDYIENTKSNLTNILPSEYHQNSIINYYIDFQKDNNQTPSLQLLSDL